MPTYEYHCPSCESTYELREGFSAPTTHVCQECGQGTAKRVLHAPPVVFKGSGWYITDSRKSSTAVSDSSDKPSEKSDKSEPAASTETKTESTPAKAAAEPAAAAAS